MSESWDSYCARVSQAEYDGLETWLPALGEERTAMFTALKTHKLSLDLLSGGGGSNFEQYLASFIKNVEDAAQQQPDYINCHTGK